MNYGVQELVDQSRAMGYGLGVLVNYNGTPKKEIKELKSVTRRKLVHARTYDFMVENGATQEEINKAMAKIRYAKYTEPTDKKKMDIRLELQELGELEQFFADGEVREEMEIDLPYDMSHKEFVSEAMKLDFRPFFGLEIPQNDFFECLFINGNFAWYSKDKRTNIYRYFTRNTETKQTFGFNIFDLTEIVTGHKFKNARKYVARSLQIKYKEGEWEILQELKLHNNIEYVIKANALIKKDYPELFRFVRVYLPELLKLLNIGLVNITGKYFSVDNESVFYSSSKYIANFGREDSEGDRQKANRAINIFATLGLVTKANQKDVPHILVEMAKTKCGTNAQYNNMNFYTFPMYDQFLLRKANERVKELNANKVSAKDLTRSKVATVFGEEYAYKVFAEVQAPRVMKEKVAVGQDVYYDVGDDDIPF